MFVRFALVLAGVGCLAAAANAQIVNDPNLTVTSYVTGLNAPTQIRFLGTNDLFITEKNTGRVLHDNAGTLTTALDLNVANESERGVLGITLDPNFASNKLVYLYYSATNDGDGGIWTEN